MSELTITHTPAEGTLIEGTGKDMHGIDVLKHYSWRWSQNLGSWFRPQSRDRLPNTSAINATAEDLRKVGHTVALELDETLRPAADVEADRQGRAEARAEALAVKAARKEADADTANQRMRSILDALPPGGEPVKIGHHCQGRHRRGIARAETAMGASVAADQQVRDVAARAATAAQTLATRHGPVAVASKIERIKDDLRALDRKITGSSHNFGGGYIEMTPPATGGHRGPPYAPGNPARRGRGPAHLLAEHQGRAAGHRPRHGLQPRDRHQGRTRQGRTQLA